MFQMIRLTRYADFMMFACAEDGLAVCGAHDALNHGETFSDLHYARVYAYCCTCSMSMVLQLSRSIERMLGAK